MSYNIKEPKIWFVTTVEERNAGGVPRLKLLPGQYVPKSTTGASFEKADTDLNIQAPTAPRTTNPVGTIFAVKHMEIKAIAAGTKFYSCEKNALTTMDRGVSSELASAYKEYQAQVGMPTTEIETEEEIAAKPESLLDKLLKKYPLPTVDVEGFFVRKELWAQLLFNVNKGYNTMLVGESGCGKTELTALLAKIQGRPITIFDMSAKQDPIASLIGVHRFEGGKSIFDRADFTYKIEQEGIVVLDELPRAPMNTNNILFPVLDSRRELTMDVASHELRSIKVHEKCRFIATANEGFRYTGNNVIDAALKERFQLLMIEFMPADIETKLLQRRKGADAKSAATIVKTATSIRGLAAKEDISVGVSVRHTLYAADLYAGGFSLPAAMENAFLPLYTSEDERKRIKDLLASR